MAAIEITRASHGSTGRIGSLLALSFGAVAAWNDARVTRNSLSRLTDRELEDIGLIRGDIDFVASKIRY